MLGALQIIGWIALSLFGVGCILAIALARHLIPMALRGRAERLSADTVDNQIYHSWRLR
jgi:hypothetical protein